MGLLWTVSKLVAQTVGVLVVRPHPPRSSSPPNFRSYSAKRFLVKRAASDLNGLTHAEYTSTPTPDAHRILRMLHVRLDISPHSVTLREKG
jgi:hypothetical protein